MNNTTHLLAPHLLLLSLVTAMIINSQSLLRIWLGETALSGGRGVLRICFWNLFGIYNYFVSLENRSSNPFGKKRIDQATDLSVESRIESNEKDNKWFNCVFYWSSTWGYLYMRSWLFGMSPLQGEVPLGDVGLCRGACLEWTGVRMALGTSNYLQLLYLILTPSS